MKHTLLLLFLFSSSFAFAAETHFYLEVKAPPIQTGTNSNGGGGVAPGEVFFDGQIVDPKFNSASVSGINALLQERITELSKVTRRRFTRSGQQIIEIPVATNQKNNTLIKTNYNNAILEIYITPIVELMFITDTTINGYINYLLLFLFIILLLLYRYQLKKMNKLEKLILQNTDLQAKKTKGVSQHKKSSQFFDKM